jgi:hypothetical protein
VAGSDMTETSEAISSFRFMILKEPLSEMKEKKLNLKMSKPQQVKSKSGSIKRRSQSKLGQSKRWSMSSYLVVDGITKWSKLTV